MKRRGNIVAIGMCLIIAGFFASIWHSCTHVSYGIGEENAKLSWLPSSARNVTYYEDWLTKSAQFSVKKVPFIHWLESKEFSYERVTEETKKESRVPTSRPMLESVGELEPLPEATNLEEIIEYMRSYRMEFEEGDIYYSIQHSNGGGVWIGYDESEERGYYYYAHH